ncbi:alpha/beta hydrolase [Neobacillus terrae]|uniref:alpha/beta hydrolase n=1 Tax=Neobacillus terrae TaxID=3034837 RepID=UPI0014084D95|nr:alpha/beta fold hydrolase [Neobacillus terrae]NHM33181.1 alpha/beta fold hydrolase [Neobacillus terrae]
MIGCLCIHGFTGAPWEVEPLSEFLLSKTDWKIVVPTLPGHGEFLSLKGIRYQEWIEHAESELKKLLLSCERVYVIGFSMGRLIASYLAGKYPVEKLVLLSAAAYYINPPQLAADLKEMFRDAIQGKITKNELFLRYKGKITQTPIEATLQFRRLVSFTRPLLPLVEVPTLIAQGESDGIVPLKSAEYIYTNIGAKEKKLTYIRNSKHHICHCDEKEALFSQVLGFLK